VIVAAAVRHRWRPGAAPTLANGRAALGRARSSNPPAGSDRSRHGSGSDTDDDQVGCGAGCVESVGVGDHDLATAVDEDRGEAWLGKLSAAYDWLPAAAYSVVWGAGSLGWGSSEVIVTCIQS